MTNGEIQPLNVSGVEPSCETQSLQGSGERSACSKTHHRHDPNQLAPLVAFLHLAVDQARRHLPLTHFTPSATHLEPVSKMGSQGIKVQV
jgi:hypothetical protein